MLKIRPHHLLCLQSFEGKGYDEAFTLNMSKIVKQLKSCPKVELVSSLDDVCSCCPLQIENKCLTEQKVQEMDFKVLQYFNLQYRVYNYCDLVQIVQKELTKTVFDDICQTCEWYEQVDCFTNLKP